MKSTLDASRKISDIRRQPACRIPNRAGRHHPPPVIRLLLIQNDAHDNPDFNGFQFRLRHKYSAIAGVGLVWGMCSERIEYCNGDPPDRIMRSEG